MTVDELGNYLSRNIPRSREVLPPPDAPVWKEAFEGTNRGWKSMVAHAWLRAVDTEVHKQTFDWYRVERLYELLSEHHEFVAEIHDYLDSYEVDNLYFDGTVSSIFKHDRGTLEDADRKELAKLVEALWFDTNTGKEHALSALPAFILTIMDWDTQFPSITPLMSKLAWQAIDEYDADDEFIRAGVAFSQIEGLLGNEPSCETNTLHSIWRAMTYYSREAEKSTLEGLGFNPNNWDGLDIPKELADQPLQHMAHGIRNLLCWHAGCKPFESLDQAITEKNLFAQLHPEDNTAFDVLNRWAPQGKGIWSFEAATGGSLNDAVQTALSLQHSGSTPTVILPDTLNPTDY